MFFWKNRDGGGFMFGRGGLHHHSSCPALDNNPKFRCLGCCHVHTGTLLVGFYNLTWIRQQTRIRQQPSIRQQTWIRQQTRIRQQKLCFELMCIGALTFVIMCPEFFAQHGGGHGGGRAPIDFELTITPHNDGDKHLPFFPSETVSGQNTPDILISANPDGLKSSLERYKPRGSLGDAITGRNSGGEGRSGRMHHHRRYSQQDLLFFTRKRIESGDAHLALALLFGLAVITAFLIWGTIKRRPAYLLPFFCFQVFDFLLACLTAVGHYTWLPNLHHTIARNANLPLREHILSVNTEWLALLILIGYIFVLCAKAYFIGVVWACYQYLHLRNASMLRYSVAPSNPSEPDEAFFDAELLLPPDYETATKMPKERIPVPDEIPPPQYTPS